MLLILAVIRLTLKFESVIVSVADDTSQTSLRTMESAQSSSHQNGNNLQELQNRRFHTNTCASLRQ